MEDIRTIGLTAIALLISMQDVTPVLQVLSLVSATIYSIIGIYKKLKK
tara:strand:- start:3192 stop:3335 length:144 start_codon:yes stop_codon:yes gene_type:complete